MPPHWWKCIKWVFPQWLCQIPLWATLSIRDDVNLFPYVTPLPSEISLLALSGSTGNDFAKDDFRLAHLTWHQALQKCDAPPWGASPTSVHTLPYILQITSRNHAKGRAWLGMGGSALSVVLWWTINTFTTAFAACNAGNTTLIHSIVIIEMFAFKVSERLT